MGSDVNIICVRERELIKKVTRLLWRCYRLRMGVLGLLLTLLLCYLYSSPAPVRGHSSPAQPRWSWSCDPVGRVCVKTGRNQSGELQSQAGCRLRCAPENYLWPLPAQPGGGGHVVGHSGLAAGEAGWSQEREEAQR